MKIVSACLAGIKCSYKQKSNACQKVIDLVASGKAIPVCPEQLGGMPTPRIPSEKSGNKVISENGDDVTLQFIKGAKEAFRIAKLVGCNQAILKANSPSCGSGQVYDGTFSGTLVKGDGIFAKLLKDNGVTVISEKEI
jgi:uncharacterized protein YbbK (DUF523 family)